MYLIEILTQNGPDDPGTKMNVNLDTVAAVEWSPAGTVIDTGPKFKVSKRGGIEPTGAPGSITLEQDALALIWAGPLIYKMLGAEARRVRGIIAREIEDPKP
jgi:hypothetical protein